jgi:predicted alpha/beta superfamily hydrolase
MRARCYTFLLALLMVMPLCAAPQEIKIGAHRVLVSLPESYAKSSDRYPVIYVTDAELQFDHTVASAAALAEVQRMPEAIVVGTLQEDRNRELLSDEYAAWFERELIPAIESRYRTQPFRIFAGHSLGGIFAMKLMQNNPQLFGAWVIVSPSPKWKTMAFDHLTAPPMLFLAYGGGDEEDLRKGADELAVRLSKHAHVFEDDDHLTAPIAAYEAALRRIYKPWFFRVLDTDDTSLMWRRAVEHYRLLTQRYGYEVPIPEPRVSRIGNRLLDAGDGAQAIDAFEYGVEHYPQSDRMRDGLIAAQACASPSRKPRR